MDNMLPTSGEEYLRMVRAQARKCPAVVVASGEKAQKHLAAKNTSWKYRTDWQSCIPSPEGCAPTPEWKDQFMEDFHAARATLRRYKHSHDQQAKRGARSKKNRTIHLTTHESQSIAHLPNKYGSSVKEDDDSEQHNIPEHNNTTQSLSSSSKLRQIPLPKLHEEQKWRTLLYGPTVRLPTPGHASTVSTVLDTSTALTVEKTASTITASASPTVSTREIQAYVRQEGMTPTPQFLIRLNQGHLIQLLKYHLRWLAENDIQEQEGKWLYALFLKLDPLVESDQVAILRNIAKKCAQIRSHFNSESGSRLATVNMIITIVARLFGQEDLE
ncbi:gem (nuclear organelle) associated protein 2 [Linnemannia zychae]|nr:gem (nuclear organelle) associated protein 2 [Linnemannia zychae]